MWLFLLLANYIAALVAVQFLRGDLSSQEIMNFKEVYNSFVAMYQVRQTSKLPSWVELIHPLCKVFSSENWTDVLFSAFNAEAPLGQSAFVAILITVWLFLANCECPRSTRCRLMLIVSSHNVATFHCPD